MRTAVHRSPVLLLACALCLATGSALVGLARTVGTPGTRALPSTDVEALAVVRRFYAAANAVLATGDAAALDAVLVPGFVDHNPAPGVEPTREGLAQLLRTRHATFPGERLVVDHATVGDGEVAVRVHAEAATDGAFLGLPLP
jgi:SnoaL-like polyketide cyclase